VKTDKLTKQQLRYKTSKSGKARSRKTKSTWPYRSCYSNATSRKNM